MRPLRSKIEISERLGVVSTLSIRPKSPTHLLILAHGAGASMEHPFMEGLAEALASKDIATLRYNFPYMEQGRKRPDVPPVAHKTIYRLIEHAQGQELPVLLGGKSFGGRMSSQAMALKPQDAVKAMVFYGFPLHSPAKPGTERAQHLHDVLIPMLFLQGDRDALAKLDLIKPLLDRIPLSTLRLFEGANHSFRFPKKTGVTNEEALDLLAIATREFLDSL